MKFCIKFRRRSLSIRLVLFVTFACFIYFVAVLITAGLLATLTKSEQIVPNLVAHRADSAIQDLNPNILPPPKINDDVKTVVNVGDEFVDYERMKMNGHLGECKSGLPMIFFDDLKPNRFKANLCRSMKSSSMHRKRRFSTKAGSQTHSIGTQVIISQ
jgi:hypothetical protein